MMVAMLRFVIVPATLILGATWLFVLRHSLFLLLPFLTTVATAMFVVRLFGLSPFAFFVSPGGYVFRLDW
jgi:hypothetical protein